jgi:hypothetical protein
MSRLAVGLKYGRRHSHGQEVGTNLDLILDSVERLVLPEHPKAAFELLVAMFEADKAAMEHCGDHGWEVVCAYKRAVGVIALAAKNLPYAEVVDGVNALIEPDEYGVRADLASVIPADTFATGLSAHGAPLRAEFTFGPLIKST